MFEIVDIKGTIRKVYAINGHYFLIYVDDSPGEWLEHRGWQYLPMEDCIPASEAATPTQDNRCVACGSIIPEGMQVCRRCMK